MLYIPKIDDYLEILTDEEVKDFAAINSKSFSSRLQLINTKPMIKNKLKALLSELKKFK